MNMSFYAALERLPLGGRSDSVVCRATKYSVFGSEGCLTCCGRDWLREGSPLPSPGERHADRPVGPRSCPPVGALLGRIYTDQRAGGAVLPGRDRAGARHGGGRGAGGTHRHLAGENLLDWPLLAIAAAVALLSSVIPYSLELEALRKLPARVFGVLMSIEPAMAAIVGFVVLVRRWASGVDSYRANYSQHRRCQIQVGKLGKRALSGHNLQTVPGRRGRNDKATRFIPHSSLRAAASSPLKTNRSAAAICGRISSSRSMNGTCARIAHRQRAYPCPGVGLSPTPDTRYPSPILKSIACAAQRASARGCGRYWRR